jgi:ribosome-binding protein aMBF1 (putative translation factor)
MERYSQAKLRAIKEHARDGGRWDEARGDLGLKVCAIIETAAERRGVTVRELLRTLAVHQSLFDRWRAGANSPTLALIARIEKCGVRVI